MRNSVQLSLSREVVGKATAPAQHAALNYRLQVETVTLEQLRDHLCRDGYSICCAELKTDPATGYCRGRKNEDYQSASVVLLDLDDGRHRLDDLQQDPYLQRYAAFVYTTPSHSEEHHRLRIVFALETPITDPQQYKRLVQVLSAAYSGDDAATDAVRLFYGSPSAQVCYWGNFLPDRERDQLLASSSQDSEQTQYQQDVQQRQFAVSSSKSMDSGLAAVLADRYGNSAAAIVNSWDVGSDSDGRTLFWYHDADNIVRGCTAANIDSTNGRQAGPSQQLEIAAAMPAAELTLDDLQEMLEYIPAVQEHLDWKKVVAGVFNYYGCDSRVLSLLSSWSPSTIPYSKLYSSRLQRVSIGSVVWQAQQHGYRLPTRKAAAHSYSKDLPLYGAQFVARAALDVPVYLVESERAAVVASPFVLPYVVAAIGPVELTRARAQLLAGRDVFVVASSTGNRLQKILDVLHSVGARPVAQVDGVAVRDYLLPGSEADYDLADYYLSTTVQPTAEFPQLDISLDGILPDLDLSALDELLGPDPTVLAGLADVCAFDVDVLATRDTHTVKTDQVEQVRTALLRAMRNDTVLPYQTLLQRLADNGVDNGLAVYSAGLQGKPPLLRLDWSYSRLEYDVTLQRGSK